MTDEHKRKISEALKGKMPKFIPNNKGRKHSLGWINKWKESRKGFKQSEAWKKMISQTNKNEKNVNWKGDKVGYVALHSWIVRRLGKPKKCEHCGTTANKTYHWANKDHKYKRNLNDWMRLCVSCHRKYDYHGKSL